LIVMVNNNTLDHLLEIEASAAAIVEDAQKEAEKRIHENEEKNRVIFDERYKAEIKNHLTMLNEEIDRIKIQYNKELDKYRGEIAGLNVDKEAFCALFSKYILAEVNGS